MQCSALLPRGGAARSTRARWQRGFAHDKAERNHGGTGCRRVTDLVCRIEDLVAFIVAAAVRGAWVIPWPWLPARHKLSSSVVWLRVDVTAAAAPIAANVL